jgi:hypothetical protein
MRLNNRLTVAVACWAILAAVTLSFTGAAARTNRAHHRPIYGNQVQRFADCPVHRNAYGELIDCRGWRLWSGSVGWDNSCFNLDYLPGQFACSPTRR